MATTAAAPETPPMAPTAIQRRNRLALLVELLALIPIGAIAVEVLKAPKLQYIDYWYTLLRFTGPDGSTDPLRLLNISNDHPVLLPSIAYWLDAHLFGGDNRALGALVIVVAAATVLGVRSALPKSLDPFLRAGLVVAAAGMVFSLHGLWNYTRAMSGIAWLTANLLVVLALLLAAREKWWPAWLVGLLACVTYGTGFAVWPALALVAALKRAPKWRWIVPLVVGVLIVGVWAMFRPGAPPGPTPADDIGSLGYNFLILVGHLWTSDTGGVAAFAGGVVLGLYAALMTTSLLRDKSLTFWWGLALHGLLGSGMIAVARVDTGAEFGLESRYTSLSVLMCVPLVVLLAVLAARTWREHQHRFAVATVVLGVVAFLLGSPNAVFERGAPRKEQELQAIAMRAGVSDMFSRLPESSWLLPPLRAMNHYPFSDAFSLGCGGPELGSTLDTGKMQPLGKPQGTKRPAQPVGQVEILERAEQGARLRGWAFGVDDPIRCAVLTDASGKITGGGVTQLTRRDVLLRYFGITPDVGFEAVGPVDKDTRVVFVQESGALRWTPAESAQTKLDGLRAAEETPGE